MFKCTIIIGLIKNNKLSIISNKLSTAPPWGIVLNKRRIIHIVSRATYRKVNIKFLQKSTIIK